MALATQRMMANQTAATINANSYEVHVTEVRLERTWRMLHLDPACFDAEFYRSHNPDLPAWPEPGMFLQHWATSGQFEPRKYRCDWC